MIDPSKASRVGSLFPAVVATEECDPLEVDGVLYPEERAFVRNAVPSRVREFTAGRLCARKALERVGALPGPLLVGVDRAPVWPEGVVGSITHTRDYCAAAVVRVGEFAALGLDVEPAVPLERSCWETVLTPPEVHWLEAQFAAERGLLAKVIFSAKECTYKCHYLVRKGWLDFHDVEIEPDLARGTFGATFLVDANPGFPRGTRLQGRIRATDGRILTAMILRGAALTESAR